MIQHCFICLEGQPALKEFSCSCKGYIHDTCLNNWNNFYRNQCPLCRKTIGQIGQIQQRQQRCVQILCLLILLGGIIYLFLCFFGIVSFFGMI